MRAIIVDDDIGQTNYLAAQLIDHCPNIELIKVFNNPLEGLLFLGNEKVDLVFLDVEMPEISGLEFIEIFGVERMPCVIFTTSFNTYAVQAFKVNAVDYLLKPIGNDELIQAVKKASLRSNQKHQESLVSIAQIPLSEKQNRLVLADGQSHLFVELSDIIRIKGSGSYSEFHMLDGKKITTSKRLNFYWMKLQKHVFIRTHQSHIVNTSHVLEYNSSNGGELCLKNDHFVPVSARNKQIVKKSLGIF